MPRLFSLVVLALAFCLPSVPVGAQTAADVGEWRTLPYLMPINPIHVGLLKTGRVLVIAGSENEKPKHDTGLSRAAVWDPATGSIVVQDLLWDLFCNGFSFLADGRALVIGGSEQYDPFYGEARATIFDPLTEKFNQVESMADGRWYATGTTLADGRVLAFSGLDLSGATNTSVEIYQVGSGWGPEHYAPFTPPLYPWLHLLPNGTLFYSGSGPDSHLYNPTTNAWTLNIGRTVYGVGRNGGSSVLLPLRASDGFAPRVMIMGGSDPSTATAEVIDLSAASPQWRALPPMSKPRIQMNAVLLPDGSVLAQGGSAVNESPATASLEADLFYPLDETWLPAGVAAYHRLYHSVALLLPDATVWTAGSNPVRGSYVPQMEIYTPPYLFTTDAGGNAVPATRPRITGAPALIGYGGSFSLQTPDAASAGSIALMRPGSDTHAWDMEQRMVELAFSPGAPGNIVVSEPPNPNVAPPGYYMLFLLDAAGVPSVARFVQVSPAPGNHPPAGAITSPSGNVTVAAGSSVNFLGTASDADGGPLSFAWIFPDGAPAASSAQNPGAVRFDEVGTHVASLTVLDAVGANDPNPPTRVVTVIPAPLSVQITSPTAGATVRGSVNVVMSVTGASGASNAFTLSVDGSRVVARKTVSGTQTTIKWSTRKETVGPHTLTASVVDAAGRTGTSAPVAVTVAR
jgi:hypothetical protein